MAKRFQVRKSSGESQEFSEEKLLQSLKNVGASNEIATMILAKLRQELYDGIPTKTIYKKAFQLLRSHVNVLAARYSLKNAIMQLGPTGYPFERYVGELLQNLGYNVSVGKMVHGRCVQHEIDVVATNDEKKLLIECKYHNAQGRISSVQIPLYIQSRFLDVKAIWETLPENADKLFQAWVVTNTRFSADALSYGKCMGMHLVGWDYPRQGSLKDLIQNTGLFPLTVLTGLNKGQKAKLIEEGAVLCADLDKQPDLLTQFNFSNRIREKILDEARSISGFTIAE